MASVRAALAPAGRTGGRAGRRREPVYLLARSVTTARWTRGSDPRRYEHGSETPSPSTLHGALIGFKVWLAILRSTAIAQWQTHTK